MQQLERKGSMRKVEILAPAGSYESLKAAVYAGCDAVYIGGNRFGARAFANNLEEKDMLEAIDFIHLHGKQIYMTVNTLLKEEELQNQLYEYIKPYYEQGLDAVIVQDVGVLKYIHEYFPDLPIHASTQMTLTGGEGVKLLKDFGVTRMVPARELSLEEIKEIRKTTKEAGYPVEIECFVHGALCYCYSGQCLMSSMIGGRSGNRGRCAQPCRMNYTMDGEKRADSYLLSPKDICTVSMIPDLVDAGIDSFKIEGRMKRPEYTAYTTHIYGKYVDLYLELGREGYTEYLNKHKKEYEEDISNLMDLYNRGSFTTGYYNQHHGKKMMSLKRPNHNGVLVGEVVKVKGIEAQIKLSKEIYGQDVLEFRNEKEENLYDYTVKDDCRAGMLIKAKFKPGSKIVPGNQVYRTKNQKLLSYIADNYLEHGTKIPIKGVLEVSVGEPVKLQITDCKRNLTITVNGDIAEAAQNQPMTEEKLLSGIKKISNTEYEFVDLIAKVNGDVFIPAGKLKELRREAISKLEEAILKEHRRTIKESLPEKNAEILSSAESCENTAFFVTVWKKEQLKAACKVEEVKRIAILAEHLLDDKTDGQSVNKRFEEMANSVREASKECYLALPYIDRGKKCETLLKHFDETMIDGFLVRSMEQIAVLKENYPEKAIMLDSNLYTLNNEAKQFWREKGIYEYTTSVELNAGEITAGNNKDSALIVYGHLPHMITAQCLLDNCKKCQKDRGYTGYHTLKDRVGKEYRVVNRCDSCYNVIYDGQAVSLLEDVGTIKKMGHKWLRLDFTMESLEETEQILKTFRNSFCEGTKAAALPNTTKGHFYRGIE